MRKLLEHPGTLVAVLGGALSIVIGLLDIFHVFELGFLENRLEAIVLVLIGLMMEMLVSMYFLIEKESDALQSHFSRSTLEQIGQLRSQVHSRLNRVVPGEIDRLFGQFTDLLTDNRLQLSDPEKFRGFYKATLAEFPAKEFWATSLPYRRYFWRDDETEQAMQRFIRGGGKMTRIFFINSEQELQSPEVIQILSRQAELDVTVYTGLAPTISRDLRRTFMVDSQGQIAWETFAGPNHEIERVEVVVDSDRGTDHDKHSSPKAFVQLFQELKGLGCVHLYRKPGAAAPRSASQS